MWSVATEWQIYFLFPLIMLPVWRKWGKLAAVIVGFAFGEIPTLMFKNFCWTFPFYLGLFALGMTAAVILLSEDPRDVALRERTPWGLVSAMFGAGFIAWIVFKPHMFIGDWQIDPYVAVGAACFIIYCARKIDRAERKSFVLRIFESKAALKLGAFSYSVYLVHHPIVVVLSQLVLKHHWSPIRSLLTLVVLGVPFVLVLAYGFHVLFERPFQTSRSRKRLNAEAAFAAVSSGAEA
jgi:peptidoglycan/LPS O-acetylase OafA/YrhL